jgi:hypothetical protein
VDAGVVDELDELRDRWHVDLLHLSLHHLRRERGEAGQRAQPGGRVQPGVSDGGHLDLGVAVFADRVEPEEGEEEVGLDSVHAGAVGHDQAGVDALERAFRDDDRDFLDRLRFCRFELRLFKNACHR